MTRTERTILANGCTIEGEADSADETAPEPTPDGFPSQWHRDRYIHDLRRSITDAQTRLSDDDLSDERTAVFEGEIAGAIAELERLGEWETPQP